MSRLLRAGTGAGSPPDADRSANRGFHFTDLPSGLASLVFHFTVLIVLGMVVTETSRPHLTEVIVDWSEGTDELAGGGGGTDGTLEVEEPAELDSQWNDAAEDLAAAVPDAEPMLAESTAVSEWGTAPAELESLVDSGNTSSALADLAAVGEVGLRGIGRGGGKGRGHGPGEGDGTGPGSQTGMFGLRDEGSRIVYVFDRSESMNSKFTLTSGDKNVTVTFLEAAKQELAKSVNELSDGAEFQMVFYNDMPLAFPDQNAKGGISIADAKTKEFAQAFIYQLAAELNTNHLGGLEMALALRPDVIFLMTDGEAKDDPTSGDLRRIQKLARRAGTRINVIHFCFEERPNSSLTVLAERTQGQFKSINIRSLIDPKW